MQVAGLKGGRADIPAKILIQTEFPDHPLYHALRQHNYDLLAQTLLEERRTAGFPPVAPSQVLLAPEGKGEENCYCAGFSRQRNIDSKRHRRTVEVFDPVSGANGTPEGNGTRLSIRVCAGRVKSCRNSLPDGE